MNVAAGAVLGMLFATLVSLTAYKVEVPACDAGEELATILSATRALDVIGEIKVGAD